MRIIIDVDKSVSDIAAMEYVMAVMNSGRISDHKNGKHYCWATVFKDGTHVGVRTKKNKKAADSFFVFKKSPPNN